VKKYYYTHGESGHKQRNRKISVYKIQKDGEFSFVDSRLVNSSSYMGDEAIASQILNKKYGYRLSKGCSWEASGYRLESKNIKVLELPKI
jgi:hypothetical protein